MLAKSILFRMSGVLLLVLAAAGFAQAAPITFGAAMTISSDTDVYTDGSPVYAYSWSSTPVNTIVNGVSFTGSSSNSAGGTDVALSGSDIQGNSPYNGYGSTSDPFNSLSTAYKDTIKGANYSSGTAITVTLNNLTIGQEYAVQFWYQDARAGLGFTETLASVGGNSVVLNKNVSNLDGGVGQYAIGFFTADAETQVFTATSATSYAPQVNALQLRAVPEPGCIALLASALLGLLCYAWKKRR